VKALLCAALLGLSVDTGAALPQGSLFVMELKDGARVYALDHPLQKGRALVFHRYPDGVYTSLTADEVERTVTAPAPLGVLLPRGLGLRIDNTDMGSTGFIRCLPNGCVSEVLMDDALIKQLRTGKQAMFIIFQTPEEGIGVPISLAGFGEGFDALP